MDWSPLESNPEVLNQYLSDMGFCTAKFSFHEVLCFEDWAYQMVPKPVISVVFLFPPSKGPTHRKILQNAQVNKLNKGGFTIYQRIKLLGLFYEIIR
jgi:ubiquitin carboxyl-terminal hydrolase L3